MLFDGLTLFMRVEKSGVQNFSAVATENGKREDSRELKKEKAVALQ